MAAFLIICGLVCAVIAAPLYDLVMFWLNRWQRFYISILIGMLLLSSSVQILKAQQLRQLSQWQLLELIDHPKMTFFLALTIGWLICSFFHAAVSLFRGWGPAQEQDATPQPVQD